MGEYFCEVCKFYDDEVPALTNLAFSFDDLNVDIVICSDCHCIILSLILFTDR